MTIASDMDVVRIRRLLAAGRFEFTHHAFRRAVERNISENEIRETGATVQLIEDYPDDKYAPSCLLLGYTRLNRPLHLQVTLMAGSRVRIITLYQPNEAEWKEKYSSRR